MLPDDRVMEECDERYNDGRGAPIHRVQSEEVGEAQREDEPDGIPENLNRIVQFLILEFLVADLQDAFLKAPLPRHELSSLIGLGRIQIQQRTVP